MNKLNIAKTLDIVALLMIVILLALYLFLKWGFVYVSLGLILICVVKMSASMLKSAYYADLYNDLKEENALLKASNEDMKQKMEQNNNK